MTDKPAEYMFEAFRVGMLYLSFVGWSERERTSPYAILFVAVGDRERRFFLCGGLVSWLNSRAFQCSVG